MSNELVGTRDWLVTELSRSFLLSRQQLAPLVAEFVQENPLGDADAFAVFLVRKNALSRFQAERARDGEAKSLVMGPYLLEAPIGTGSMGTVYRAVGKTDRQAYAVKVVPQRSLWNVRMARRQVRAFAELRAHATVVPFVDVGTAEGKHYLVWPLVDGEPLESLIIRHGPLPWQEAARISLRIAEGLQFCHDRSIFHGLLKPSNIMAAADGAVRLLDFGIGALLAENTDESLLDTMSTANATASMLDCTSPECILDPAKRSPAGDQYSLGCVLYFFLTARYPFPEGNMIDKMMAHQTQQPRPIHHFTPQVPPELEAAVARLMQKAPEARYRHFGEFIQELHAMAQGARSGLRRQMAPVDTPRTMPIGEPGLGRRSRRSIADQGPAPARATPVPVTIPNSTVDVGLPSAPPASVPEPPDSASTPMEPLKTRTADPIPLDTLDPLPMTESEPGAPTPESAPAKSSNFGRVLGKLAFWRSSSDTLACSVLAPPVMFVGETATLPLFAHSQTAEALLAVGRTYFPAHQLVGSAPLPYEVARGARLTFRIALPGLTVEPAVQEFVWRGQIMPLPFAVQVPPNFAPGEIIGVASVGEGSEIILNFEFRVMIGRE